MKKRCACLKITLICLMFLTVLPSCSGGRDKDQKIKILTGPEEGIYHKFINSTIDRLKNKPDAPVNPGNNKYDIYSSPGSIFNLERLTRGQAHFAIAQADVISDRVGRRGYKIQGVAPLFREYIYIFRLLPKSGEPGVNDFNPLDIQRINIPGKGSGTYLTAERFMELAEIDRSKVVSRSLRETLGAVVEEAREGKFNDFIFAVLNREAPIISDISDGWLDGWYSGTNRQQPAPAWLTNGKPNSMYNFYKSQGFISGKRDKSMGYPVEFISIPKKIGKSMKDLYGIYENESIRVEDNEGSSIDRPISTLFMRAFIVVRSDEKKDNVSAFLDYFSNDDTFTETIISAGPTGEKGARIKWPVPIHVGASETLSNYKVIEDNPLEWTLILYIILVIVFIGLSVFFIIHEKIIDIIEKGKSRTGRKRLPGMSKRRNVFAILCLSCLLLLSIFATTFIKGIEESASRIYGYESPFINMGLGGVFKWLLTFTISGNAQGIFPSVPDSITILILLNIVLKVMGPATIGIYAYQLLGESLQREYGFKIKKLSGHVVFVGWNKTYSLLVKNLVDIERKSKFVIITQNAANPLKKSDLPYRNVCLVRGSPLSAKTLEKACIDKAQGVYLVSPPKGIDNYLTGLPIYFEKFLERLRKEKKLDQIPPIFILGPENERKSAFERLKLQDTTILERDPAYIKLVRSLFFGSGIYSLLTPWVESKLQSAKNPGNPELTLSEVTLDREKIKENSHFMKLFEIEFKELLDARDNIEFIVAYEKVEGKLKSDKQKSTLVGISLKYKLKSTGGQQTGNTDPSADEPVWSYLSAPEIPGRKKDEHDSSENDKIEKIEFEALEKAVLYIMGNAEYLQTEQGGTK